MRVVIWQQFSSNHSTNFTVVGSFSRPHEANEAADELRNMLRTLADWYDQNPEMRQRMPFTPSPLEVAFAQQYGVDWGERGIDWFWNGDSALASVTTFENLVMVKPLDDSWTAGRPFDRLLAHLGGEVLVATFADANPSRILVTLSCRAPDVVTAQAIDEAARAHLEAYKAPVPWATSEQRLEALIAGNIQREGQSLRFNDLHFSDLPRGLPALVAYLTARGCTEIEYHLRQVDGVS
jgi:hypothetical protein